MDVVENRLMTFFNYAVATGFGAGMVPKAPGTAGSALAVILAWLFFPSWWLAQILLVVATCAIGIWTSQYLEEALGETDPQIIVIDEVAGQFLTFLFLPLNWTTLLLGFLLFRLFDIWKPGPIGRAGKLPGGVGVVADDILAGFAANILLQIVVRMIL